MCLKTSLTKTNGKIVHRVSKFLWLLISHEIEAIGLMKIFYGVRYYFDYFFTFGNIS